MKPTSPMTEIRPCRLLALTLVISAVLAACAPVAVRPDGLADLHARLSQLQNNPDLAGRAPLALKNAEQAVSAADQPEADPAEGVHRVFMAGRRISIAEETARNAYLLEERGRLVDAGARLQLDARTREADLAKQDASNAQAEAGSARQRATDAQADASSERQRANQANQRADDATVLAIEQHQAADLARDQAQAARSDSAQAHDTSEQLQSQLNALNARVTDRGTVVTLGDLLFATGTADLNSGGSDHLLKLANFLNSHPERTAAIEGYTDNVGSRDFNLGLSQRRADAVKDYLVSQGVAAGRMSAEGKGKSDPVGDNHSATGRQQNRRVEVVFPNEKI